MENSNKSQEMRTVKMIGSIKTIQPVNISLPNTKGMPKSHGRPMIPASSIRGWLRHCCHDGITKIFYDAGIVLDVDTHYLIASGVDTGRVLDNTGGQSTEVGFKQEIREKHPMLSLWGYWGLAGKMSVGSAIAPASDALFSMSAGARQHVFKRNEALHSFVDTDELERLQKILSADKYSAEAVSSHQDEIKKLNKESRETTDKDRKDEITSEVDTLKTLIADAKEKRVGSKESIQRPLEAIEAINEGETLPHRMILKNPSNIEIHLALWSIAMASLRSYIGGHSNLNFGEISAEWQITETSIKSLKPKKLGVVGFNDIDGFYCTVEGFDYEATTAAIVSGEINVSSFEE